MQMAKDCLATREQISIQKKEGANILNFKLDKSKYITNTNLNSGTVFSTITKDRIK